MLSHTAGSHLTRCYLMLKDVRRREEWSLIQVYLLNYKAIWMSDSTIVRAKPRRIEAPGRMCVTAMQWKRNCSLHELLLDARRFCVYITSVWESRLETSQENLKGYMSRHWRVAYSVPRSTETLPSERYHWSLSVTNQDFPPATSEKCFMPWLRIIRDCYFDCFDRLLLNVWQAESDKLSC